MEVFNNCRMDWFAEGRAEVDFPCRVRIDDDMVVVEYEEDEGEPTVVYRGHSHGQGHYRLRVVGFKGEATLHRFHDAMVLEGTWREEASTGMWRITLGV